MNAVSHVLVLHPENSDIGTRVLFEIWLKRRDVAVMMEKLVVKNYVDLLQQHQIDGVVILCLKQFSAKPILDILRICPAVMYYVAGHLPGLAEFEAEIAIRNDLKPFASFQMPSNAPHIVDRLIELIEQS